MSEMGLGRVKTFELGGTVTAGLGV